MKKITVFTSILLCTAWMANGQWTYTSLSEPKFYMGSVANGTKAFFAGGFNGTNCLTTVETYDVATGTWEIAGELFVPREVIAGVSCGSKVFFAGGFDWNISFDVVDIYDVVTHEWSVELLSVDRFSMAAVSYGSKVLFAGGVDYPGLVYKNIVEIYDIETGGWSITYLSLAREGIAAAVVGDLALFAGGVANSGTTNRVDIYNFTTGTWSQASLSQARGMASATTAGTKVIIAGGITSFGNPSDRVDIYDALSGTWTTDTLSVPRASINNGATISGRAYFAGGGTFMGSGYNNPSDVVDVYDPVNDKWSVDYLMEPLIEHSVVGVGDHLLVAGGINDLGNYVSTVEIFYSPHIPVIIHVPGDYPSIQEGINAAAPGDTVLVADSTYYENIDFIGKAIVVASEFIMDGDTNHINNTIINGSQPVNPDLGSVVTFTSGEDTTSVLCGFTITGGSGTYVEAASARAGGGVFIQYSGGKILNNHIEYNQAKYQDWAIGGGITAGGPISPLPWIIIRNNRINHNVAQSTSYDFGEGGGVLCYYNLIMTENEVSDNVAKGAQSGQGGGVYVRGDMGGDPSFIFKNNILTQNKAITNSDLSWFSLGGGFQIWMASGVASGNTFMNNEVVSDSIASSYGSGVFIQEVPNDDLIFENNFIKDNTFSGGGECYGGGLCLWITGGTYLNNVIQNNAGTYGGGIFMGNSPLNTAIFINNTITGNDAGGSGTGLHISSSNAVVINSILYNNTPPGPAIFDETSSIEVRYSDVEDDEVWPGEGNVNCSPSFLEDGYHLDPSCQLLNAGITTIEVNGVWYNCPALDIDGEPRPFTGTQPEIGVDELQTTVAVGKPISSNPLTINVFPNPAGQTVMFDVAEGTAIHEVNIYTQTGQKVFTGAPENSMLDVSALQPGIYFIEIFTDQSKTIQKLIIQ